MSNFGLDEALAARGGKVVRTKVGDRYVIEEMVRQKLNLGGEQSGHVIFRDFTTTGDGIITALQVLRIMKPLFRAGNYEAGLATGIDLICKAIRGEYKGSGKTVAESHGVTGVVSNILPFIIFMIVLMLLSRFFRKRGYGYSSRGGGPVFIPSGGGGGWSSGDSGGGGFSGFGGGGGSFGGGGAGSSW